MLFCRLQPPPNTIVEILPDKLTRFHPLNSQTSTLLSDLTSPALEELQHQGDVEAPGPQAARGRERPRSPEPNIQFVQNVLRETREMMRNRNIANKAKSNTNNRSNKNKENTTNTNNVNNSDKNSSGRGRGRGRGRDKPNKE